MDYKGQTMWAYVLKSFSIEKGWDYKTGDAIMVDVDKRGRIKSIYLHNIIPTEKVRLFGVVKFGKKPGKQTGR